MNFHETYSVQRAGFEPAKVIVVHSLYELIPYMTSCLIHYAIIPTISTMHILEEILFFKIFTEFSRKNHIFWLKTVKEKQFLYFFIKTFKTQNFPVQFFQISFRNSKLVKILLNSASLMEPPVFFLISTSQEGGGISNFFENCQNFKVVIYLLKNDIS